MTMPINLVLVRHGESEGNVAVEHSKKGDSSLFTDVFKQRHSSEWRLSDTGVKQAICAGKWIKKNIPFTGDDFYTSAYLRARETAALLDLPGAQWKIDDKLRERDRGAMDVLSHDERGAYKKEIERKRLDPFHYRFPSGESIADTVMRMRNGFMSTAHRQLSDKNVFCVCHGEVMWAFRFPLEYMLPEEYNELDRSKHPHHHIHNCQIIWYSRQNPENGQLSPTIRWVRSVCPWDMALSSNDWHEIIPRKYTNAQLLAQVKQTPRIING